MPKVIARPIGYEDRLSIVDHLDELRTRLIVCVAALVVAFGLCYWQNHRLLDALNHALPTNAQTSANHLNGLTSDAVSARKHFKKAAADLRLAAGTPGLPAAFGREAAQAAGELAAAARALPENTPKRLPITTGVGEPFTTTLTVAAYFALLLALPLIIYQGYAFVIPALNPRERRVAKPLVFAAPLLFLAGVAFAYFFVLPPAVRFLQGYNSQNFDILVQAKPLYTFEILTMLGIGLAFQMPLGLLGLHQAGVIDGRTLTRHWRYAVVGIAVAAAALPGADPVSILFEAMPLVILYLASIVLLRLADRRKKRIEPIEFADEPAPDEDEVL